MSKEIKGFYMKEWLWCLLGVPYEKNKVYIIMSAWLIYDIAPFDLA